MDLTASNRRGEGSPTILLVEDFDDTRLMMKMWLTRHGYRVLEAETGEEGVEMAQREHPDLIIMDMMMPGMNGLDATQLIRQDRALRLTPIVAVSAYGVDEYRRIALAAGCNEYISTPFEPGTLANLIKTLLDDAPTDLNAPETDSTH
jgi:CheY-like chemotaxis protein